MTESEYEQAMSVMDRLPTLPTELSPGNAALWAANTLLIAALERGWPQDEMADLLLTLVAVFSANRLTDDELHVLLQKKLDAIRAHRAVKQ